MDYRTYELQYFVRSNMTPNKAYYLSKPTFPSWIIAESIDSY